MATPDERLQLARAFLQTVHGLKPDDQWLCMFTLPDHTSRWYQNLEDAAQEAARQPRDCYAGCAWGMHDMGKFRRVKAEEAAGIPGMWQDLDYQGLHHKKLNLPPDHEALLAWVAAELPPPSVLIHSGYGYQAYWLFREAFNTTYIPDRERAINLGAAWTSSIRGLAQRKGWEQDATGDLSRVLRIPGTMNLKDPTKPKLVSIQYMHDEVRYTIDDLEAWVRGLKLDIAAFPTPLFPAKVMEQMADGLAIKPDAAPPFQKWEALKEAQPKVLKTFDHARSAKELPDQSASAYDLALASFAAQASWTDQEITDLLVAHRVRYQEDLKRPDYYARTIKKAREGKDYATAVSESLEVLGDYHEASPLERQDPSRRGEAVHSLGKLLGIPLQRVVRYATDPKPTYRLETAGGAIDVGGVKGLIDQQEFRANMASLTGRYLRPYKAGEWSGIAQGLLDACEPDTLGEETTYVGRGVSWVLSYLTERPVIKHQHHITQGLPPFLLDGTRLAVFTKALWDHVKLDSGVRITYGEFGAVMKALGAEPCNKSIRTNDGKKVVSRSMWLLPDRFVPQPESQAEAAAKIVTGVVEEV